MLGLLVGLWNVAIGFWVVLVGFIGVSITLVTSVYYLANALVKVGIGLYQILRFVFTFQTMHNALLRPVWPQDFTLLQTTSLRLSTNPSFLILNFINTSRVNDFCTFNSLDVLFTLISYLLSSCKYTKNTTSSNPFSPFCRCCVVVCSSFLLFSSRIHEIVYIQFF